MKKIIVIGSGGAGKSTLSAKIGNILQIPVFHLDRYFWKPGWVETGKTECREILAGIFVQDKWIIDGNYEGTLSERLGACDTVIFMDYKRYICYWGVLKRYFRFKGKSRPDMCEGCDERIDVSYIRWLWSYPKIKERMLNKVEAYGKDREIIMLKNRKETSDFLKIINFSHK